MLLNSENLITNRFISNTQKSLNRLEADVDGKIGI